MDALGKVLLQKKFQNASGQVSLNLENLPQKAKFLRLAEDNSVQTYYLGQRNVLKKVEEAKASFFFRKDGFEDAYYQMSAENETGVVVTMFAKGSVSSSSIAWIPAESSSSEAPSSSSPGPVDCTGKQLLPGNTTYTIGNREYILHVPNSYTGTTPVPLLVDYHPIGGSASQWASSKTYEAVTESDQVIIIYPNGDASAGGFSWGMRGTWVPAAPMRMTSLLAVNSSRPFKKKRASTPSASCDGLLHGRRDVQLCCVQNGGCLCRSGSGCFRPFKRSRRQQRLLSIAAHFRSQLPRNERQRGLLRRRLFESCPRKTDYVPRRSEKFGKMGGTQWVQRFSRTRFPLFRMPNLHPMQRRSPSGALYETGRRARSGRPGCRVGVP